MAPASRVLRYSSRQWAVLAAVSLLCTAASFLPVEGMPARALLAVVPYMLIPAGVATGAFALVAAVRTQRFRRNRRTGAIGTSLPEDVQTDPPAEPA